MQTCDFTKSLFHFETDHVSKSPLTITAPQPITRNQVRVPLECRCEVTDPKTGTTTHYVLGASCKTEKVNVDRDLWMTPNADFCVVASETDFLIIKRFEQCDLDLGQEANMAKQTRRQVGDAEAAWVKHRTTVRMAEAHLLESPQQITEVSLNDRPINSRTEFELSDRTRVMIEYPVKTINVSERDGFYQVDTGPVLFPDLAIGHESFVGNFRLAYIAHNCPDWAEFLVNVPTSVTRDVRVDHYSKPVRLDVRNKMCELVGPT